MLPDGRSRPEVPWKPAPGYCGSLVARFSCGATANRVPSVCTNHGGAMSGASHRKPWHVHRKLAGEVGFDGSRAGPLPAALIMGTAIPDHPTGW